MSNLRTIYSKPNCFACKKTKDKFLEAGMEEGVDFTVINMAEDAEALAFARSLNVMQAPLVIPSSGVDNHWSGMRPDLIAAEIEVFKAEKEAKKVQVA